MAIRREFGRQFPVGIARFFSVITDCETQRMEGNAFPQSRGEAVPHVSRKLRYFANLTPNNCGAITTPLRLAVNQLRFFSRSGTSHDTPPPNRPNPVRPDIR
jgi:hypothetical protein